MFENLLALMLTPTTSFWLYLLAGAAGVMIGVTINGNWRQWIE
ncbi:hypothetical protein [Lacticaseibacillus paracasei]|nr:hypothetical protein [Lacticaseibacillus paracasei]